MLPNGQGRATLRDADVMVVGAGIVGAWVALAAAREGRSTVLLEAASVGHAGGSSHGTSRFRQLAPHPTEAYLDHGLEALAAWRHLEDEAGIRILHPTGNLSIGDPEQLEAHARVLAAHDMPSELVAAGDASARWPGFSPGGSALFQPDGDAIAAAEGWHATVAAARRAGAVVREGVRALAISEGGGDALVRTDAGEMRCGVAVLAVGPWVGRLAEEAGIDLNVSVHRQTVVYLSGPPGLPTITDWSDREPYALPDLRGGLKLAEHARGPAADPDVPGEPDPAAVERLLAWARRVAPGAHPVPIRTETCLYTMTVDEAFAIVRFGRRIAVSACSGQGFQYAPVVARQVASLLDG